jgi:hypothetical protein
LNKIPTHTIAIAKPLTISGHVVAADISAFSAVYELKDSQCLWDITDMITLSFFLAIP